MLQRGEEQYDPEDSLLQKMGGRSLQDISGTGSGGGGYLPLSGGTMTGSITLSNSVNIPLGTGAGTKIGTATTQKLGFFNATPIVQPAANADTSGATLAQLETEVNELKQLLRNLGLLAT
jgi:hypothetical protein